jgi:hypothetical protein
MLLKKYTSKATYLVKQKNGILNLAARTLLFVLSPIFVYEKYNLAIQDLNMINDDVKIRGDISSTKLVAIRNNNEYDKLILDNSKFQAFFLENKFMENYRTKFNAGGLLYLLVDIKENEIICSNWVSLNQNAFKSMNTSKYSIDFSKEAHLGGWYTNQKYRGLGFNKYLTNQTCKYLLSIGKTHTKGAIAKNNLSSMRSANGLGIKIYGETIHLRVLMFNRWKEVIFE